MNTATFNINYRKQSFSIQYFSLTELLIVIAIMALLSSIVSSSLQKSIRVAEMITCLNNLRGLGSEQMSYADDHAGMFYLYSLELSNGSKELTWVQNLKDEGYVDSANKAACPSLEQINYNQYKTYGIRSGKESLPSNLMRNTATKGTDGKWNAWNRFYALGIEDPSHFFVLSDTIGMNDKWQTYLNQSYCYFFYKVESISRQGVLHLRHSNRVSQWYADGHADALAIDDLLELPLEGMPNNAPMEVCFEEGVESVKIR